MKCVSQCQLKQPNKAKNSCAPKMFLKNFNENECQTYVNSHGLNISASSTKKIFECQHVKSDIILDFLDLSH